MGWIARVGAWVLAAGCLLASAAPPPAAATEVGTFLVVQLPVDPLHEGDVATVGRMLRANQRDGGRIIRVDTGAAPRVLTEGFHDAADPDVSFDGQHIVFAGKRDAGDPWNLFEMRLDGSEVRQITRCESDCRDPVYQGTMYSIAADHPWRQLSFVSDRPGEIEEAGSTRSTSLYSVDLDGSNIRRLTFNPSSDMDPAVLPDGRLVFASWQRSTLDRGDRGRVALFAAHTDGLDYALFAGDPGRRIKHMPCVTVDRLVLFVESDGVAWDGAGSLASVSLRRNLHSYHAVTQAEDGLFAYPSPLPDGGVLVSRRPADGRGTHAVVRLDPRTGAFTPVFDDPRYHDVQAVSASARPEPDGRSSVVVDGESAGKFYCLSVHETDVPAARWVAPGSRPRLRVLEGVPRKTIRDAGGRDQAPALLPRRMLGEIPVEQDGSFQIRVPADVPIELQLLDDEGMAMRTCGWIWAGAGETRGCIGCHEDPERTPENRLAVALTRPAVDLTRPTVHTVDFRTDVFPVVSERCATAACHGGPRVGSSFGQPVDAGDAYQSLLAVDTEGRRLHVDPGRARTSPLVRHVTGRDPSRPWDVGSPRADPDPGSVQGALTDEELRILIEWIDLGAAWIAPAEGDTP